MQLALHLLFSICFLPAHARKIPQPRYGDTKCDDGRGKGDCNVERCVSAKLGYACEARFVHFHVNGKEFSRKTCRCLHEPICSLVELGHVGCNTYKNLTRQAQHSIRRWTMSEAERSFFSSKSYSNEYYGAIPNSSIYSDASRHIQILEGDSRFCCRIDRSITGRLFFGKRLTVTRSNASSPPVDSLLRLLVILIALSQV